MPQNTSTRLVRPQDSRGASGERRSQQPGDRRPRRPSASPCSRRIRQLEESRRDRARVVRLDPRKIGFDLTVLIHIRMDRHTPERFAQFEASYARIPRCRNATLITGQEADYQLKIAVPNMEEYQRFLLNKITRIEGVIGVHSSFVLRKAIDTTALPLAYAREARLTCRGSPFFGEQRPALVISPAAADLQISARHALRCETPSRARARWSAR